MTSFSPDGLTPDAGWRLAVSRTLPAEPDDVWRRLLGEWLPRWLGVDSVPQMVGAPLRDGDVLRGRVVGAHVGRRVRVRWTPKDLDHETIFQVTLQDEGDGTQITLHQERLLGAAERQGLLEHWTGVLDALVDTCSSERAVVLDLPG